MSIKKPLLLFDMDGTLLDTRLDIARAANNARRELGLPLLSVSEVVQAVGDGVNLFVSRVTYPESDSRFSVARKIFLRHYAENIIGETKPYDGIVDLLNLFLQQNVPMAIVSNKPERLVDELVRHFSWQKYFKTWLGGDSASQGKPSAEPLLLAKQKSGYDVSHEIIMIGDGHQDILAAKAAGCRSIWCSWGFNEHPTYEYPSDVVHHPRDIAPLILT